MLKFESKVEYHHDNLEIVHKIDTLTKKLNTYNEKYKTTENDAVPKLRKCLPTNIITWHVKNHQDSQKQRQYLSIPEILNIEADE